MKKSRSGRVSAVVVLTILGFALLFHELGALVLAELGLVEQLLSAGGADSLIMLILALLFMMLRLFLSFIAPGLVLISLSRLVRGRSRPKTVSDDSRMANECPPQKRRTRLGTRG